MKKNWLIPCLVTLSFLFSHSVQAKFVRVIDGEMVTNLASETTTVWEIAEGQSAGQLLGAYNVNVDGALFDVVFDDRTFAEVFVDERGLDALTSPKAIAFSTALINHVFIDAWGFLFDSDPTSVNGCGINTVCYIHTPFEVIMNTSFLTGQAENRILDADDDTGNFSFSLDQVFDTNDFITFADWESSNIRVLEPSATLLMLIGVAGLAVNRRRSKKIKRSKGQSR